RLESIDRLALTAELIVEAHQLGHESWPNPAGRAGARRVQAEAERGRGFVGGVSRERFTLEWRQAARRVDETAVQLVVPLVARDARRSLSITKQSPQLRRRGGGRNDEQGAGVVFGQRHHRGAEGLQSADANQPRPAGSNHRSCGGRSNDWISVL